MPNEGECARMVLVKDRLLECESEVDFFHVERRGQNNAHRGEDFTLYITHVN